MTAGPRRRDGASRSLTGPAAALLPEGTAGGAGWHARVPARLDAVVASMSLPARTGIRAAATALDGYAVARTGRRLADLSVPERESVVGALGARPALLALLDVVKVPVLLAAGTERMVQ